MSRLHERIASDRALDGYVVHDLRHRSTDVISDDGRIALPRFFEYALIQAGNTVLTLNEGLLDGPTLRNVDKPEKPDYAIQIPYDRIENAGGIVIGRSGIGAALDLDITASNEHFRLSVDQEGIQIADISRHGTLVAAAAGMTCMAFTRQG